MAWSPSGSAAAEKLSRWRGATAEESEDDEDTDEGQQSTNRGLF